MNQGLLNYQKLMQQMNVSPEGQEMAAQGGDMINTLNHQQTAQMPPQPSLMQRMGQGAKDFTNDPVNMANLAASMNSMVINPNEFYNQNARDVKAEQMARMKQQAAQEEANKTLKYFHDNGRPDLVEAVQHGYPIKDAISEFRKSQQGGQTYSTKPVGSTQIDPVTGQVYGVSYNPQTQEFVRSDVDGAIGQTPNQQFEQEAAGRRSETDGKEAYNLGLSAYKAVGDINNTVTGLFDARDAIDDGARSGWFDQHWPAFSTSTAKLKSVARGMGIDIINSATFGALSKEELNLALQQGLPMELDSPYLKDFINDKIVAQRNLAEALENRALVLMSGKGLTEIMAMDKENTIKKPDYLAQEDWLLLSNDQQRAFVAAGAK